MSDSDRPRERRRYARGKAAKVRVTVRGPGGRCWEGRVVNVSAGGVALQVPALPPGDVLEVQPAGSDLRASVRVRTRSPFFSRYVLGCAFLSRPTPELLRAFKGAPPGGSPG
jgi:hypothetical protein